MVIYTIDELNSKSIFEIRALAREVGVHSPAKKNKPELMDLIIKISSGIIAPPTAPLRGRPPKKVEESAKVVSAPQDSVYIDADKNTSANCVKENVSDRIKTDDFIPVFRGNHDKNRFKSFGNQNQNNKRVYVEKPQESVLEDSPQELMEREGFLEISPDGYGFLRVKTGEFNEKDAYVRSTVIRQYGLRKGDYVKALCRSVQDNKPPAVVQAVSINGIAFEDMPKRPNFDELVPIYPDERLRLEVSPREFATRCIDLVSPIGKGQRGIIVSPPKAGKTTLLKMIASSITANYPDVELKVLLIDERPEEVTDMQRSIKGEVVYSTFDQLPENHTKTADMLLERCKRLVEAGKDVVILLDSLTRLARAYNLTVPPTGRTLSGGIDPGALHAPKRFFGSARNIENGGSLTIIATALIDTGSRMDDVIFEEFKGTGNMEIHLDRKLSEKRIFPAIDLAKSGTRKEELLLTPSELEGTWGIRKMLSNADNAEATENLIQMIVRTSSNKEFMDQLNLQLRAMAKEGYIFRTQK